MKSSTTSPRCTGCRRALAVLLLLLLTLLLPSCGASPQHGYFDYLRQSAQAEIAGKLDGMAFSARLSFEPAAQTEQLPAFYLQFHTPEALAGVTVRYDAATQQYEASLGSLCMQGDFSALALPCTRLLQQSAVSNATRQQREQDGRQVSVLVVRTQDGYTRVLDAASGIPLSLSGTADGRAIALLIKDWVMLPASP